MKIKRSRQFVSPPANGPFGGPEHFQPLSFPFIGFFAFWLGKPDGFWFSQGQPHVQIKPVQSGYTFSGTTVVASVFF